MGSHQHLAAADDADDDDDVVVDDAMTMMMILIMMTMNMVIGETVEWGHINILHSPSPRFALETQT